MRIAFLAFCIGFICQQPLHAQEILGADAAVQKVTELSKLSAKGATETEVAVTTAGLAKQISRLENSLARLKPDEHATEWLRILEGYTALVEAQRDSRDYELNGLFPQLIAVLPPPATWPQLVEKLRAREVPTELQKARPIALMRMIAATLANDKEASEKEQKSWSDLVQKSPTQSRMQNGYFPRQHHNNYNRQSVNDWSDLEPAQQIEKLEKIISEWQESYLPLNVPALAKHLDEEKADALIDKILLQPQIRTLNVPDAETMKLVKQRALALADRLPRPHWELVKDADDLPLYEIFVAQIEKKQGNQTVAGNILSRLFGGHPTQREDAEEEQGIPSEIENIYLAKLLDDDRLEEAAKILKRRVADATNSHDESWRYSRYRHQTAGQPFSGDRGEKLLRLYEQTFAENLATLPWEIYLNLAAKHKDTESVQAIATKFLADEKILSEKKDPMATAYFEYLLQKDLTKEAMAVLRSHLLVAEDVKKLPNKSSEQFQHALKLHLLGDLLENKEWQREGIAIAEKRYGELLTQGEPHLIDSAFQSLLKNFVESKRYPDAERLAIETLALAVRETRNPSDTNDSYSDVRKSALLGMCIVYDELGRHKEVLELLDKAPWWGTAKLSDLLNESQMDRHFGVLVARAMTKAGKPEIATQILDVVIDRNPGLDPAYELLILIDPAGALDKLSLLAKRDPYQERPLIWRAKIEFEKGEIDKAEKTINEAIAIDPSDGEQGKNTRMFGYKILADILRKKGNEEGAKTFDGAVAAIRKSERADDYRQAGLPTIARKMYQESLELFNDAYCIQSRLALQFYEAGDLESAAIHFERAFQLMPSSFGMIESHCFGCEGAFSGALAQALAEDIFLRLLEDDPKKPQVHYLLGYLRTAQERPNEAIKHYQEAVRLAPQYLNAWQKLAELTRERAKYAAVYDAAMVALLKVDPRQIHCTVNVDEARDLAKIWAAIELAGKQQISPPSCEYELAAVKSEQAQREAATRPDGLMDVTHSRYSFGRSSDGAKFKDYPAKVLSINNQFTQIQQLLLEN